MGMICLWSPWGERKKKKNQCQVQREVDHILKRNFKALLSTVAIWLPVLCTLVGFDEQEELKDIPQLGHWAPLCLPDTLSPEKRGQVPEAHKWSCLFK